MVEKLSKVSVKIGELQEQNNSLQEQLTIKDKKINRNKIVINKLSEQIEKGYTVENSLKESIQQSNTKVSVIEGKLVSANKKYENELSKKNDQLQSINEQLLETKKDLEIVKARNTEKVSKLNESVEQYKKIAQKAVSKYIDLQAQRIGVTSNEIRSKLNEHYTFNDIDRICEDLQGFKVNMSKLPFNLSPDSKPKIKTKPVKESMLPVNEDDIIDSNILKLAGIE